MYYYVKVATIRNHMVMSGFETYKYQSDTKCGSIIRNELTQEVLQWAKELYNENKIIYNDIIIETIIPSYLKLQAKENLSEEERNILEISKKEVEDYNNSYESKKEDLLEIRIPWIIDYIKQIRNTAEQLNLLDSQEYLSFLDTLNKLSID